MGADQRSFDGEVVGTWDRITLSVKVENIAMYLYPIIDDHFA